MIPHTPLLDLEETKEEKEKNDRKEKEARERDEARTRRVAERKALEENSKKITIEISATRRDAAGVYVYTKFLYAVAAHLSPYLIFLRSLCLPH